MMSVNWTTVGDPTPQGSKRYVGNGIMVESSKNLPFWREQLINDIANAADGCKFESGVQISLIFRFPCLQSHLNTKGQLKPNAPFFKITRPDIDKLCRGVLDAITLSGVIRDDSFCFSIEAQKVYCRGDERPGVVGTIMEVDID